MTYNFHDSQMIIDTLKFKLFKLDPAVIVCDPLRYKPVAQPRPTCNDLGTFIESVFSEKDQ